MFSNGQTMSNGKALLQGVQINTEPFYFKYLIPVQTRVDG